MLNSLKVIILNKFILNIAHIKRNQDLSWSQTHVDWLIRRCTTDVSPPLTESCVYKIKSHSSGWPWLCLNRFKY